ncbi:MAG: TetR/AcrR family transcriptional regulator [Hyphomicrobium sp.]
MTRVDAPVYRDRLKADLLRIAERRVEAGGLDGLQARPIAAEAGCSVGTLYNIFGDLDGLIVAVNRLTLDCLAVPLAATFETTIGQPTEARLTELALAYMRFALDNQSRWRAVFEHRHAGTAPDLESYRADQGRLLALIEAVVAGEIASKDQRRHAARALFAAVHGILSLALDNRMSAFDAATVEAEIRFIVRAAARGLSEPG